MKEKLMKYGIWVVVGVVGLVVVVGVPLGISLFMLGKISDKVDSVSASASEPKVAITKENVVKLNPFITNLADTTSPKYISLTVELVLTSDKEKESVDANLPLVRDTIVALLSAKKSQEVSGEAGANTLKNEIQTRLNTALGGKNPIAKVLITDLVIQH